jgi:hypothetical protein
MAPGVWQKENVAANRSTHRTERMGDLRAER